MAAAVCVRVSVCGHVGVWVYGRKRKMKTNCAGSLRQQKPQSLSLWPKIQEPAIHRCQNHAHSQITVRNSYKQRRRRKKNPKHCPRGNAQQKILPKKAKMVAVQQHARTHMCPYRVALYSNIFKAKNTKKTRERRTCPQAKKKVNKRKRPTAIGGWNMEVNAACPSVRLSVFHSL